MSPSIADGLNVSTSVFTYRSYFTVRSRWGPGTR